jgi:hypothetical protein
MNWKGRTGQGLWSKFYPGILPAVLRKPQQRGWIGDVPANIQTSDPQAQFKSEIPRGILVGQNVIYEREWPDS